MSDSDDESLSVHDNFIFLRIPGVIGRHELVGFFPHSAHEELVKGKASPQYLDHSPMSNLELLYT